MKKLLIALGTIFGGLVAIVILLILIVACCGFGSDYHPAPWEQELVE